MNQTQYTESRAGVSQEAAILKRLQDAKGGWVPMPELSRVSGSLNIHSRISDLRRAGYSIEQRSERHGRVILSFYRLSA